MHDGGYRGVALTARKVRASRRQPDLLRRQRLCRRRLQCAREQGLRRVDGAAADFLLGNPQQRPRMLGHRRENLLVDRARIGGPAAGFVPGCERKGVLDGGLHDRRRARARRTARS